MNISLNFDRSNVNNILNMLMQQQFILSDYHLIQFTLRPFVIFWNKVIASSPIALIKKTLVSKTDKSLTLLTCRSKIIKVTSISVVIQKHTDETVLKSQECRRIYNKT